MRQQRLHQQRGRGQVEGGLLDQMARQAGGIGQRTRVLDGGVVDQDRQVGMGGQQALGKVRDRRKVGQIGGHGVKARAGGQMGSMARDGQHGMALRQKQVQKRRPDAGGRAGQKDGGGGG